MGSDIITMCKLNMAGILLILMSITTASVSGALANCTCTCPCTGTSLLNAASEGYLRGLKEILSRGVNLEFSEWNSLSRLDGKTALLLASENGHVGIIRELLDRGANIEAQDKYGGRTALHLAALWNHL